jgi:hypothetical protein
MEEYRDGLLLFDLMEKEIWDKAVSRQRKRNRRKLRKRK